MHSFIYINESFLAFSFFHSKKQMKFSAAYLLIAAAAVFTESVTASKGKVFDHILQIWFENQVKKKAFLFFLLGFYVTNTLLGL